MNAKEYYISIKQDREEWRSEQKQVCMWCGNPGTWIPLQIHEICPRSAASRSWGSRCNYLLLDGRCHSDLFDVMPKETQLALKEICDPANANFQNWLEIRGRGDVEWVDVKKEVERLMPILCPPIQKRHEKGLVF